MNNDLISRQAAIYNLANIEKNCAKSDKQKALMGRCIYMIENIPSAQPEPSTEIQKILNCLDTTLHPIVSPYNWYVYSELYDMVSMLPSAQQEQNTGQWIPNKHTDTVLCSQCGKCYGDEYNYCPNCGAKMEEVK